MNEDHQYRYFSEPNQEWLTWNVRSSEPIPGPPFLLMADTMYEIWDIPTVTLVAAYDTLPPALAHLRTLNVTYRLTTLQYTTKI